MRSRPLLLSSVRRSSASRRLGAVGVSLVLATMLVATSASAATMVLSYTAGASGHGETELVELAADGPIVRGKLPGLVAAVRGQPVWLKPQAVKVRTVDCECVMNLPDPDSYDESKPPAACTKPRSLQVLALHNATTGKVAAIGKAPRPAERRRGRRLVVDRGAGASRNRAARGRQALQLQLRRRARLREQRAAGDRPGDGQGR